MSSDKMVRDFDEVEAAEAAAAEAAEAAAAEDEDEAESESEAETKAAEDKRTVALSAATEVEAKAALAEAAEAEAEAEAEAARTDLTAAEAGAEAATEAATEAEAEDYRAYLAAAAAKVATATEAATATKAESEAAAASLAEAKTKAADAATTAKTTAVIDAAKKRMIMKEEEYKRDITKEIKEIFEDKNTTLSKYEDLIKGILYKYEMQGRGLYLIKKSYRERAIAYTTRKEVDYLPDIVKKIKYGKILDRLPIAIEIEKDRSLRALTVATMAENPQKKTNPNIVKQKSLEEMMVSITKLIEYDKELNKYDKELNKYDKKLDKTKDKLVKLDETLRDDKTYKKEKEEAVSSQGTERNYGQEPERKYGFTVKNRSWFSPPWRGGKGKAKYTRKPRRSKNAKGTRKKVRGGKLYPAKTYKKGAKRMAKYTRQKGKTKTKKANRR